MKTIIVPTDFSPAGENAVKYAVGMAIDIRATVWLLHVYQVPVLISNAPDVPTTPEETKAACEARLAKLKAEIDETTFYKINVVTEARQGNVADELQAVCSAVQPFAVVMGNCQSGKLQRVLFGSATLEAIHYLNTPVLIVPSNASYRPVQRIGLAYDFNHDVPLQQQQEIYNMVKHFNAELHILNVEHNVNGRPHMNGQVYLLDKTITALSPEYHFIDRENIKDGLNDLAKLHDIDFMIIVPRKHSLPESLFHRSRADKVALHADVPLMAIHE